MAGVKPSHMEDYAITAAIGLATVYHLYVWLISPMSPGFLAWVWGLTFYPCLGAAVLKGLDYFSRKKLRLAPAGGGRPVALITGASGGLGASYADVFAGEGYDLVLVARTESKLDAVKARNEAAGATVHVVPMDLCEDGAAQRLYDTVTGDLGLVVDVLVNNAGLGYSGKFLKTTVNQTRDVAVLNMVVPTELMHLFLPSMVDRKAGGVLNISSTAGAVPGPLFSVYYASKAYFNSLSYAVQWEVRRKGVAMTCVMPGPVVTGFADHAEMGESMLFKLNKPRNADDVAAESVAAFQRGQASYIPGWVPWVLDLSIWVTPMEPLLQTTALMNSSESRDRKK